MTDAAPTKKETAPYGAWPSPISAALLTESAIGLGNPEYIDGNIFWLEQRPMEAGRAVPVRLAAGQKSQSGAVDLAPKPFNVRSRVHEYGGLAHVFGDDAFYFVNFADSHLYKGSYDGGPPVCCSADSNWRYAEPVIDAPRQRLLAVGECHHDGREPTNALVALPLGDTPALPQVLHSDADFYGYPILDPDGSRLAWITWSHPNMPWDGTDLWVGDISETGALVNVQHIGGGSAESVLQPVWDASGNLIYVSDRSGFWNLYRHDFAQGAATPLCPKQADFGGPLWQLGEKFYRLLADGRIVCRYIEKGITTFGILADGQLSQLPFQIDASPVTSGSIPIAFSAENGETHWLMRAATAASSDRIGLWNEAGELVTEICRASSIDLSGCRVSAAQSIWFQNRENQAVQAFYYAPSSATHQAPAGTLPPLVVRSHGGPTGMSGCSLSLAIQYWTSRGIAVVDVNYSGSTGFGREYRQRLDGLWGVADVRDCVGAAEYLATEGWVDPERLGIRGGSAGGYTTLCALTFHDIFKAGASHYGIGDLKALAEDTHKFESRYTDRLIGPLPEAEAVYDARSPLVHADGLNCPVVFFQGQDDKVVPPNQAETMVASLREKGIPVAYFCFDGEGHGFRRAETIRTVLEAELSFFGQVFGFVPAGNIGAIEIENLPQ